MNNSTKNNTSVSHGVRPNFIIIRLFDDGHVAGLISFHDWNQRIRNRV